MKAYIIVFTFLFSATICSGQFLKDLGKKLKGDAEWRLRNKADQQLSKGIDSLLILPKKKKNQKKTKANVTNNSLLGKEDAARNTPAKQNSNGTSLNNSVSASEAGPEDMTPKDGYISLKLSANTIFTGGIVLISGQSIKYKSFAQVEIAVTGPSVKVIKAIPLDKDGKFKGAWTAPSIIGEYIVTVQSSDKKAQQSAKLTVYTLPQMSTWADENINITSKVYDNIRKAFARVEQDISPRNKEELEKKMEDLKDRVDAALKLFNDLNTAGKQTAALAKSTKGLPPKLANNLSDLNNNLAENARQMKSFDSYTSHEPQDNTVCEYLVMANEACAAFSTFTNFWSTSLKEIILNVTLDKGIPSAASAINQEAGGISAPYDFPLTEMTKIFATSKVDAQSLTKTLGKLGMAGDLIQFASTALLKTYCGVFQGELKHNYTVKFRNKDGVTWWKYGVVMQGAFTLRYPKEKSGGKIIKMKGNYEGNATKFTFYENIEAEDEFQEGSKGKIEVVELQVLKPPAFPFTSSLNDPAGFGMAARTLVTPACFNMTMDAEYDVDANKITLFLNGFIIDFSPAVVNQVFFAEIGGDLFQYLKRMSFPIHKVFTTLGSVLYKHNEFVMDKDAAGNLSFKGEANKHLGSSAEKIEHDLNFSLWAKKNN